MTDSSNFISVNTGYGTVEVNVDHIRMIKHISRPNSDAAVLCFADGHELVTFDKVQQILDLMDEEVTPAPTSNGHVPPPTLDELAQAYERTVNASQMTPSSKRAYNDHLHQFVRFAKGDFEPGAWTNNR